MGVIDRQLFKEEEPPRKDTAQILKWRMQQLVDYLFHGVKLKLSAPNSYYEMAEATKSPGGRSENYARMGRTGAYVFYALIGDRPKALAFRQQVLNYFAREQQIGHMVTEQGAPSPHDDMHTAAALLARLAASPSVWHKDIDHGLLSEDEELLDATGKYLRDELACCVNFSTSTGHYFGPGFRCKAGPLSPTRDIIGQASRELKLDLPAGRRVEWERFYLGAKLYLLLLENGAAFGVPAGKTPQLPKLYAPVHLSRQGPDTYTAWMERPTGAKAVQVCNWVQVNGKRLTFGNNWTSLPPSHEEGA